MATALVALSVAGGLVGACLLKGVGKGLRRCLDAASLTTAVGPYSGSSAETAEPLLGRREWTVGRAALAMVRKRAFQALLLILYVAADAGKMFLVVWANSGRDGEEAFHPSSVLLVQLLVSALIALGIGQLQVGCRAVCAAIHPLNVARCSPVSALFFLSKISTIAALTYVDAGTVKLSTQLILPCTAVLSVWFVRGSAYSTDQWVSILTICLGTLAFHAVQMEAEGQALQLSEGDLADHRERWVQGLCLCGVVVLANSLGSVVGEGFLKGGKGQPLACLKAQLVLAELCVISLWLVCYESPRSQRGWFAGWDWRVLVCALGWVPSTWMSTIITARFSTVVKNVMQCVSTLLTYFLSLMGPDGKPHNGASTLVAFVVILTIGTLSLQMGQPETPQQAEWTRAYSVPTKELKTNPTQSPLHVVVRSRIRSVQDVLDLAVIATMTPTAESSDKHFELDRDSEWNRATTV